MSTTHPAWIDFLRQLRSIYALIRDDTSKTVEDYSHMQQSAHIAGEYLNIVAQAWPRQKKGLKLLQDYMREMERGFYHLRQGEQLARSASRAAKKANQEAAKAAHRGRDALGKAYKNLPPELSDDVSTAMNYPSIPLKPEYIAQSDEEILAVFSAMANPAFAEFMDYFENEYARSMVAVDSYRDSLTQIRNKIDLSQVPICGQEMIHAALCRMDKLIETIGSAKFGLEAENQLIKEANQYVDLSASIMMAFCIQNEERISHLRERLDEMYAGLGEIVNLIPSIRRVYGL